MKKNELRALKGSFRACVLACVQAMSQDPSNDGPKFVRRFVREDLGAHGVEVQLWTSTEAERLIDTMVEALVRDGDDTWSNQGARDFIQRRLAVALFDGRDPVPPALAENRLNLALDELATIVLDAPRRWQITAPIHGLHPSHAGETFAGVRFYVAPTSDAAGPKHIPRAVEQGAARGKAYGRSLGRDLCAVVDVLARDGGAACNLGYHRIGLAADGLSIMAWSHRRSDLVWMLNDGPPPTATLTGDCEDFGWTVALMGRPDGRNVWFPAPETRPVVGFDALDTLLEEGVESPHRVRVQRGTRLAGRSLRGANWDENVFWAVAACEALAYGKATSKSKHDLALRVALLVAKTRDDAEHVAATVLGLYKHRNEIAHGSHANIGEADMRAAQDLVARAVVAVAKSDALASMTSEEEADRHFHRLALASLPE